MKIETKFGFSRDGYRNQRALLIGINYKGSKSPLYGCQNDVLNMKKYIMDVHGFPEHNIDLLMDDGIHVNPTKSNIIDAFKKLVELSEPGDVVYVHFAGKANNTFKIFLRAFLLLVYTLKMNDILFCFMLSPSLLTKVTELMSV
ncbi:hypothetical protein FRACYDRAFT_188321 [Fragilariopsis cylindrus CCMP1102]|uniref:Peptidase C14 caspase domain-containing protein n=1 Tax=Fragilariopsis cylindrus CCMP1102 TaxID=635003 RepID=A0A1E7F9M3_9STRA|nr:hypothetical protein FRACYDRAFT_188321 [Fragilariopsis cylindrus CCMP1102]|eukprot:OEU14857.1 hypothetical protein FRACYDRAFT_188321 [Fragilariopsis cylindrus CCMP1102]